MFSYAKFANFSRFGKHICLKITRLKLLLRLKKIKTKVFETSRRKKVKEIKDDPKIS